MTGVRRDSEFEIPAWRHRDKKLMREERGRKGGEGVRRRQKYGSKLQICRQGERRRVEVVGGRYEVSKSPEYRPC